MGHVLIGMNPRVDLLITVGMLMSRYVNINNTVDLKRTVRTFIIVRETSLFYRELLSTVIPRVISGGKIQQRCLTTPGRASSIAQGNFLLYQESKEGTNKERWSTQTRSEK